MPLALISLFGTLKQAGSSALAFLSRLNGWQLLCFALACLTVAQHFALVAAHHQTARWQQQYLREKQVADAQAAAVAKARKQFDQLSRDYRRLNDEESRRVAGDAGALRVSGPGKAVCRPAPTAPGGHVQAPARPDAPGPALPPADSAAVPWGWLVTRGEEHDQLRAEVQSWRDWYAELVKKWPK